MGGGGRWWEEVEGDGWEDEISAEACGTSCSSLSESQSTARLLRPARGEREGGAAASVSVGVAVSGGPELAERPKLLERRSSRRPLSLLSEAGSVAN